LSAWRSLSSHGFIKWNLILFSPGVKGISEIRNDVWVYKTTFVLYYQMKRLSELSEGTRARIHSFENNDLFLKLMEMGCVPGEIVRVEKIAPLGDPISIAVAGYNLSLRLDEADNIFVEQMS
jgi:Fe2+ transport system protein FeoA